MSRTLRTAITATTIALALTACGPNQDEDATPITEAPATETAEAPETPATETPAPEAPEAPAPEAPADQPIPAVAPTPTTPPVPEHRPCSIDQAPDGGYYAVTGIKEDDKHGGLTARTYAGYHYNQLGLLLNGETVGTYLDSAEWRSCLVTADNNVWWEIHSPILPTGGWVNANYLTITDHPTTTYTPDHHGDEEGGDEGFDIVLAQVDCIYGGAAESCDLLALYLVGSADDNYGLGNSYSMAPSVILAEDCLVSFDQLACAELELRGPGGDVQAIATAYITAYQAGDVAGQQALLSEGSTVWTNATDIRPFQDDLGLSSMNLQGQEFSWSEGPTLHNRCIVAEGLVQFCVFVGD